MLHTDAARATVLGNETENFMRDDYLVTYAHKARKLTRLLCTSCIYMAYIYMACILNLFDYVSGMFMHTMLTL